MDNYQTFGEAIELIKNGCKVQRKDWKNEWIKIAGYIIYIKTAENTFYPWIPHQKDILSNDWIIYKD